MQQLQKICILLLLLVLCNTLYVLTKRDTERFAIENGPIKILQLILYSTDNGGPYDKMYQITSEYYKSFPNVTTYYYCFSPTLETPYKLDNNILYIQGNETYTPGILEKTVKTFEYFKEDIPNYQYIVRSNISTIIRFDLLELDLQKHAIDYGCALCFGDQFSSGTSIIFSSDVVLNIIKKQEKLDKGVIDDVSIGNFIHSEMPEVKMKPVLNDLPEHGFYFVPKLEEQKVNVDDLIKDNKIIFFRNHNGDRELDANQMKQIVDALIRKKDETKITQ